MTTEPTPCAAALGVDLDAYLARIGYKGPVEATLETLRALHFAHATNIPFENLDVYFRRPISLDLKSLQAKLVAARRGGYCFEHNTLFAAVLEALGFGVTRLAARVRVGEAAIRPRLHMLLAVDVQGDSFVADVGFGGTGLFYPIPLYAEEPVWQFGWAYRTRAETGGHALQTLREEGWFDLYSFTLEPQYPIDYEVANYYTSTHPHSFFVQSLIAQKTGPEGRWSLHNRELCEERPGYKQTRLLDDDSAVIGVLGEIFGIQLPAGTRF